MTRGGKRKGAGGKKPKLPPGIKKEMVSFRISPGLKSWLKRQVSQTRTLETALTEYQIKSEKKGN